MNKNGAKFGRDPIKKGTTKPGNFLSQVDKLNIARTSKSGSDLFNRPRGGKAPAGRIRQAGGPIRPPKAKSNQKASQRSRTTAERAAAGRREADKLSKGGSKKGKKK